MTVAYRRRLIDSPSYTLNHEEVAKALEEGIRFAEGLTPLAINVDAAGRATALEVSVQQTDGDGVWHETGHAALPARTILIAAGTQPNTVLAREEARIFTSTENISACSTRPGSPRLSSGACQAGAAGGAYRHPAGRSRDQLLR